MSGIAKTPRKSLTDPARKLWGYLRAKQVGGLEFERQEPIDNYIVDLVCFEKCLVTPSRNPSRQGWGGVEGSPLETQMNQ